MTPTTGGTGLGLFATHDNLDTVRLDGSGAFVWGTQLTMGQHFLCTNAVVAPAQSTALVVVLRDHGPLGQLPDASVDNRWGAGTQDAVDAYYHTVGWRDWLSRTFGMDSFDDAHGAFLAVVDVPPNEPGKLNAYQSFPVLHLPGRFTNSNLSEVSYTQAIANVQGTFASAPDVVSHELAHSVTRSFSRLRYRRESGALNEAFSDWIGVAFEQLARDGDSAGRWLLGESVLGLRNLQNPLKPPRGAIDPDTYLGAGWRPADATACPAPIGSGDDDNDFCYVHTNSGVGNKMFQLLVDGGAHNGVRVEGIGMETAARIAMDAQRHHWTANSDYLDARSGMVAAASDYGEWAKTQTQRAWRAVCVDDPRPPPPACPAPNALKALRVHLRGFAHGEVLAQLVVPRDGANPPSIGHLLYLLSTNPNLDVDGVMSNTRARQRDLTGHEIAIQFPASIGIEYTYYALLERHGDASPLVAVPVRGGLSLALLRASALIADSRAATMTITSGMDGTILHLALPASSAGAPANAKDLLDHHDAHVHAVAAGATGAVLSWDGLAADTDYIWHAVVVQSLSTQIRESGSIPGSHASELLAAPFHTASESTTLPSLSLSASPGRTRADVGVDASAGGDLLSLVARDTGQAAPASAEALAGLPGALVTTVAAGASTLVRTGLEAGAAYVAFAALRTGDGDSPVARAGFETLAPLTLSLSASPGRTRADVGVDASAGGDLLSLVARDTGQGAPASAEALAGLPGASSTTVAAGASTLVRTGLEAGAAYVAFAALRTGDGDSPVARAGFETLAPLTLSLSASPGRTRADVGVDASAGGELLSLVARDTGQGAPASAEALAGLPGASSTTVAAGASTLVRTGLEAGAAYVAFAALRTGDGDSPVARAGFETLAPLTLSLSASPGRTRADVGVDASAGGELRYLVARDTGQGAPASAEALAGLPGAFSTTVAAGASTLVRTGLEAGAAYVAFAALRTGDGDSPVARAGFETLAPLTLSLSASPGRTRADVGVDASAGGELLSLVARDTGQGAPASAEALAGLPGAFSTTVAAGASTLVRTGLEAGAAYVAFAALRTGDGDSPVARAGFETLAPLTLSLSASPGRTRADVGVDASAGGELLSLVARDTGQGAPASAEALAGLPGALVTTVAAGASTLVRTGLEAGAAYVAFAALRTGDGDSPVARAGFETLAPLTLSLSASPGRTRADVGVDASAGGELLSLVARDTGQGAPASAEALAGLPGALVTTVAAGASTLVRTGLEAGAAYVAFAALRTGDGDSPVARAGFETLAPLAVPPPVPPLTPQPVAPTSVVTRLSLSASPGRTRADVGVDASAGGELLSLVARDTGQAAPASAEALAGLPGAFSTTVAAGASTLVRTGLEAGAAYVAFAALRTGDGDSPVARAGFETLAPLTLSLSASPGRTRADVGVDASAGGDLLSLVARDTGQGAPASAEALAGLPGASSTTVAAGASTLVRTGLEAGAAYVAFAALRTGDGDSPVARAGFETLAPLTLSLSASPGRTRADVGVDASAGGDLLHLVARDTGQGAPASAEALAGLPGASSTTVAAGASTLVRTGLEAGAAYVAFAALRTGDGDSPVARADFETLAPVALSPRADSIDISIETDADGTLHYLILPASEQATFTGVAALANDLRARTAALEAGANALSWNGLAPDTAYVVYTFIRTQDGDSPLKMRQVTTEAGATGGGASDGTDGGGGCSLGNGGSGIGWLLGWWCLWFVRRRCTAAHATNLSATSRFA